jgi:hypothetical protein
MLIVFYLKLAENIRASPFNERPSIDTVPTYSKINLDGQCLYVHCEERQGWQFEKEQYLPREYANISANIHNIFFLFCVQSHYAKKNGNLFLHFSMNKKGAF